MSLIIDELIREGYLTQKAGKEVIEEINTSETPKTVDEILLGRGISKELILSTRSKILNVPFRTIDLASFSPEILKYVPEESAFYYRFVPLGVKDGVLEVGMVDPESLPSRDALQFISSRLGVPYKIFLIADDDFQEIIKNYKGLTGEIDKALGEFDSGSLKADLLSQIVKNDDISAVTVNAEGVDVKISEDAPITKIVSVIIRHAIEGNASDIHIEHVGDSVRVRFRVDGVLFTSLVLPTLVHGAVVARIKILANLKLDEKRKPQDGRFSSILDEKRIDFRVSTFPSYYGEKVEIRVLDSFHGVKPLDAVGLDEYSMQIVRDALQRPYGLILLCGPTGSGKTTTLYSMLNELDREKRNVVSLEDPVEYNISNISQSQIMPEIGYTFATGLRSILRQDPDVIMVGEIRDKETAKLAIQAALTGHLVFSTIHTNTAVGVIPRLIDMEVDPFLIAPTLIMAMGQRLVRKICPTSKRAIPLEGSMRKMIDEEFADLPEEARKRLPLDAKEIYDVEPSPECSSGTRGRMAVFEILKVDKDIEKVILTSGSDQDIWKMARQKGMTTMKEDALIKSIRGEVPFTEANYL